MEFKHETTGTSFTVSEKITVRQQLEYFSSISRGQQYDMLLRYWLGAQPLIRDWKSDKLPDREIDLDSIDDPDITDLIILAGLFVQRHMNSLKDIPKN